MTSAMEPDEEAFYRWNKEYNSIWNRESGWFIERSYFIFRREVIKDRFCHNSNRERQIDV